MKKIDQRIEIIYIGQKGDKFAKDNLSSVNIDKFFFVRAGKFRRYPKDAWKQLYDIKTILLNIRDSLFVILGIIESFFLFKKIKPDILFSRGGYVSVPVCLGAKLAGVKYITHDSDMVSSLANKIIGKWAVANFISGPKEYYGYPKDKMVYTGIPIDDKFRPVNESLNQKYRKELKIKNNESVILVVGGGLGARNLSKSVTLVANDLLGEIKNLRIIIISGRDNLEYLRSEIEKNIVIKYRKFISLIDFTNELYKYSGIANLIITRAGATSLAEFSAQHKSLIVVPSSYLASGHQIKNAEVLENKHAIEYIRDIDLDKNPHLLKNKIINILNDPAKINELKVNISKTNKFNASEKVSRYIIKFATKSNGK